MFLHRNWEGKTCWPKDGGDKAEKSQFLGPVNSLHCVWRSWYPYVCMQHKQKWVWQGGVGEGKDKPLKDGPLISTESLLCARHFINAIFSTNNRLMVVLVPVYSWRNCGLKDSERQTWDHTVIYCTHRVPFRGFKIMKIAALPTNGQEQRKVHSVKKFSGLTCCNKSTTEFFFCGF